LPPFPALVTTYEILCSQDYVIITFSTPTGEVKNGQMQTQEVQKLALTLSRFLEFAANIAKISDTVREPAASVLPGPTNSRGQPPEKDDPSDDSPAGESISVNGGRIVRH
jgi:hypothetical protein